MIRRVLFAAFIAGGVTGLAISVIHQFTTTPMLLRAEVYERVAPADPVASGHAHESQDSHAHVAGHGHEEAPVGIERVFFSLVTNLIAGIGFCLILAACFSFHEKPVTATSGVLWGLSGFAVFTLSPVLGLPPELPGMAGAELSERQFWWFFAVATAAAGLWLLVFRGEILAKIAGIAIIALPHVVGAPQPLDLHPADGPPAQLAAEFAATSIALSAVFWVMAGWLTAEAYRRLAAQQSRRSAVAQSV